MADGKNLSAWVNGGLLDRAISRAAKDHHGNTSQLMKAALEKYLSGAPTPSGEASTLLEDLFAYLLPAHVEELRAALDKHGLRERQRPVLASLITALQFYLERRTACEATAALPRTEPVLFGTDEFIQIVAGHGTADMHLDRLGAYQFLRLAEQFGMIPSTEPAAAEDPAAYPDHCSVTAREETEKPKKKAPAHTVIPEVQKPRRADPGPSAHQRPASG